MSLRDAHRNPRCWPVHLVPPGRRPARDEREMYPGYVAQVDDTYSLAAPLPGLVKRQLYFLRTVPL